MLFHATFKTNFHQRLLYQYITEKHQYITEKLAKFVHRHVIID